MPSRITNWIKGPYRSVGERLYAIAETDCAECLVIRRLVITGVFIVLTANIIAAYMIFKSLYLIQETLIQLIEILK